MWPFNKKKTKNLFLWRSALSKFLGLAIGLASAGLLLDWQPETSFYTLAGIVLWFTLQGGIIAIMGVITRHPLWKSWHISAWQRGMAIGIFMHVTLGLFLYHQLDWAALVPATLPIQDPLVLMMIEGAILGLLWDVLITSVTGDGKDLVKSL